jgi:predicted phage tail component-like protein
MKHEVDSVQLHHRAFAGDSKVQPKVISLNIAMTAASIATLESNIDTVRRLLNTQVDEHLILDSLSDRYWLARFQNLTGKPKNLIFEGNIDFLCLDPYAYGNSVISSDYTDNEDPEEITITPGGSALIEPVFTLTSTVVDAAATIRVRNDTLGMELTWGPGAIGVGGQLVIDSSIWHVTLNGVASMSLTDPSGLFPVLSPGVANLIQVYGFTGNVNIAYRNKFA